MSKLTKALRAVGHWLAGPTLRELGLKPIGSISAEDIVIASYPKSGVTWLQNMLAGVLYGVQPHLTPDAVIQKLVPDVHTQPYYQAVRTPMFFKSHWLPKPSYRRVIRLVRDGRDVLVSYRYYIEASKGKPCRFSDLVGRAARPWPAKWHEHVEQWIANPYGAETIMVRYEDLKRQPVAELRRICRFAELERSDEQLEQAVANAHISKLRQQEARFAGGGSVGGKTFFRRGVVGSHRDELPPEMLEAFLAEAGDTLRRCGYLDDAGRAEAA